jgi:predicted TPR repeat methyltransferase
VKHFRRSICGYNNIVNSIQQQRDTENTDNTNTNPNVLDVDIKAIHQNIEMSKFWIATTMGGDDGVSSGGCDNGNDNTSSTDTTNNVIISKCPAEYVVGLYSTFSKRFDDTLVNKLDYQTPTKLRRLLDDVLQENNNQTTPSHPTRKFQRGIDLGCGTGLSGLAFCDVVVDGSIGTFTGIDLSPEMINKARERKCYTALWTGDIMKAFHHSTTASYDLIIACDVFCYLGDLSEVFAAVSNNLRSVDTTTQQRPSGYFCFSTEALSETKNQTNDFILHECARFSHTESYIRRLADEHKMNVVRLVRDKIRKNQGRDVIGLLVIMQV